MWLVHLILGLKKDLRVKKVLIIHIIIGALGLVTKNVESNLEIINFKNGIEPLQKACLLGTARILRKVLDC